MSSRNLEDRAMELGIVSPAPAPSPKNRKPRLLIIGHGRHGKDSFAGILAEMCGLTFSSSSEFVGKRFIWPMWGQERYGTFDEFFADRVTDENRVIWGNLISAWNTPDKARTARTMLDEGNHLYVGMRRIAEWEQCDHEEIFDHVIWVDACGRLPKEQYASMELEPKHANLFIDNNGPVEYLEEFALNLQKKLHDEGFDVGYHEPVIEEPVFIHTPYTSGESETVASKPILALNPYIGQFVRLEIETRFYPKGTIFEVSSYDNVDPSYWLTSVETGRKGPWDLGSFTIFDPEDFLPGEDVVDELTWFDAPAGATPVLDHGFIQYKDYMGSDEDIAESARMSYGRGTKKVNNDEGLINYLVKNHHTSPLEMGELKVHMRLPIFVMRQLVRHRTANLNEYSGRYSEMIRLFYVPDVAKIMYQSDGPNKQKSGAPMLPHEALTAQSLINSSGNRAFDNYEHLLATGVSRETARFVLPLNTYTEVVWKMDISNMIKFLYLRDDEHSQWEIQVYAREIAKLVEEHFPLVYGAYMRSRQSVTMTQQQIIALITGSIPEDMAKSERAVVETWLDNSGEGKTLLEWDAKPGDVFRHICNDRYDYGIRIFGSFPNWGGANDETGYGIGAGTKWNLISRAT
jgi:thymidylate synthase (FAD)